jgi:hypothetical protein
LGIAARAMGMTLQAQFNEMLDSGKIMARILPKFSKRIKKYF